MGIGAKLELLLQEHHMNANELAKKIDVAPTTIYSMIKRDSRKADIEVLLKISKELGVTTEYFCDDEFLTSDSKKEPSYESQRAGQKDQRGTYHNLLYDQKRQPES